MKSHIYLVKIIIFFIISCCCQTYQNYYQTPQRSMVFCFESYSDLLWEKILNGLFCRCASKTSRRTRNSRSFILEYILGFHHFNISKMLFDSFTFSPQESLSNKLYNLVCNFALQSRSNFGSSKGEVFSEGAFNLVKSWKKIFST